MDGLIKLSLQENNIRSLDLRDFKWCVRVYFIYQPSAVMFVPWSSCSTLLQSAQRLVWNFSQARLLPLCPQINSDGRRVIYHVELRDTHTDFV